MAVSSMADSGMSEDCMKMMAQQPQPAQKPCKGMTLACIAAMGCVIPMAVRNDAPGLAAREAGPTLAFWPTSTVLRGSDLTPEPRSEEHTSELQSLMRISYAVFCVKNNKKQKEP